MNKVFIIAEAGVNHNGSVELAKRLIDAAVDAGSDAVKFQTFSADKLVTKFAQKAEYQKINADIFESQFDMLKKLELNLADHEEIINYCKSKGILFLSTPFDSKSIDILHNFGMKIFKVASGEITNLPHLEHIGRLAGEILLSTGMSTFLDIENALNVLINAGMSIDNITVLHATTEYPCPMDEVNIRSMQAIQRKFGVKVGYSDHTEGIEVSIAAVALGASVIEKHLTIDRSMQGPDHKTSLEPKEFMALVKAIRNIESAMGDGVKGPSKSEIANLNVARKSIVAARNVSMGEIFTVHNLAVKRPGTGISPMRWNEILGQQAKRNFLADELIEL